jgi:hypothetical protein
MFIKPTTTTVGGVTPQHVFSKGAGSKMNCKLATAADAPQFANNAPGVYLTNINTLNVLMDTVVQPACNESTPVISITNMPINNWFNVVIRLTNNTLDVYINGRLTKRAELPAVPNQNYDDVFICSGGGFNGYVSDLKYFNNSIGTTQINALVSNGPNTSINRSGLTKNIPPYLSTSWYQNNQV